MRFWPSDSSTSTSNLRRHRESQGLSQERIAEVLKVHRTYMGAVERGERNLTLQTIEKMATQIGVKPIELLVE